MRAWNVSSDRARWYWLAAPDIDGIGTLQTASFPDGADPTDLLPSVFDYRLGAGDSLVALTAYGDVISIPDPVGAPEEQALVDQGAIALLEQSDQGLMAYAKSSEQQGLSDLYLSKLDGTPSCTLDTTMQVRPSHIRFSPDGAATLWALKKAVGYDAFYTRNADCRTELLTSNAEMLDWLGEDMLLIVDAYDRSNATGTLRYRKMRPDGRLDAAPATVIADHVDTNAITGGTVLYTVNGSDDADGVYVRALER
jgi:hypothetical protein